MHECDGDLNIVYFSGAMRLVTVQLGASMPTVLCSDPLIASRLCGIGDATISSRATSMIRVMSTRRALSALLAVTLSGVANLTAAEPAARDASPPLAAEPAASGGIAASAAQSDAVQWSVQVLPAHPRPGDTAELVFTAEIAAGWILYSSDFSAEIGPRPARFKLDPTPGLELIDDVRAIDSLRRKDKTLKTEYAYFERHAEFRQKVKLTAPVTTITGRIDGQTCFEQSGLCQLFRKAFTAALD